MEPAFGTSGLRGRVVDLTPALISDYVGAFLSGLPDCRQLFVGRDLRASSPDIAGVVARAATACGADVVDCGAVPTPALALASIRAKAPAIMVTGSHIPADRNGLKFYLPGGEILKPNEARITAAYHARHRPDGSRDGRIVDNPDALTRYIARNVQAFGHNALTGLRIGVYRHASVARDALQSVFEQLGATVVPLGHSNSFVPVDTEAVSRETRQQLTVWSAEHALDAIASTDGDADRPLLTDETGTVIPGDVLGVLTALHLRATHIVTPVSSNGMVQRIPAFQRVDLTRIGSPFVVEAMQSIRRNDVAARVVGFEANGGFLLGFDAELSAPLSALPTRDCMPPILAPLCAAKQAGQTLSQLVATLPPVFTASGRIQAINRNACRDLLNAFATQPDKLQAFFEGIGIVDSLDQTDGLRVQLGDSQIVHLRLSGNAPEFRVYAQAETVQWANALVAQTVAKLNDLKTVHQTQ